MRHLFLLAALGSLTLVGCNTTQDDVTAARREVREEKKQLDDMKRDEGRAIREEKNEAETARTTNKPIVGDDVNEGVAEEKREADRAATTANDRIREQEKVVADAERKAVETEQKLGKEQARDKFVIDARSHIDAANRAVEKLQTMRNAADDEGKKSLDAQINELKAKRDQLEAEIDDVEAADSLKWEDHKADVMKAMEALDAEVKKVS